MKYFGGLLLLAVLMISLLVPLPISAAALSGHANITLVTEPDHPVAGEETRLTIVLRDKGQQPIANAPVQVRAEMGSAMAGMQHGSAGLTVTAKPSDKPGEYVATLKLPAEGDWKITVASGDSSAQVKVTATKPQANNKNSPASTSGASVAQGAPKVSSMEAIHAAYLDLTANISEIRLRVEEWHEGDAASLKIAQQKLERVEAILHSVSWPADMASAIGETKAAVELTAKALKEKNLADAESAVKALGDAYHEVTHDYHADWLPSAGSADGHTASAQGKSATHSEPASHGDEAESAQNSVNYYFVGSTLGVVLITIGLAAVMRRRDLRTERWEAA